MQRPRASIGFQFCVFEPQARGSPAMLFGREAIRAAALWAIAPLCAVLLAGCGTSDSNSSAASSGTKRVILLTNGADPFWDAMRVGMQDAERDFKLADAGLETTMEVNDGTPKGQIDRLRQFA